ncbi:MAG: 1-deoxy-D-xylulose-5-phosphate reductoisomerase [Candidatus Omnitrophica bacterium]|nr:1-deoxy-D-xylulose-5-phosphate reductoisomerase [Candidatus Omnitrophota bacterium]
MKTVAILGSTGSIGKNALKVISHLKDKYKVVALASGSNAGLLAEQVNRFSPKIAALMDEDNYPLLKKKINKRTKIVTGSSGIEQVAGFGAEIVLMAISGSAALMPTLKALNHSKRLALANKESLVMAGEIIINEAKKSATEIIPIDSEHSAIFQCLKEEQSKDLAKIYLTGSGGPLKDVAKADLEFIDPEEALRHPRWKMGKKITIDSATMMNKGFEIIEAKYLFRVPAQKIKVVIHPQALVHSLVQFVDGSILAQLGATDMRIPIQYALTYPNRANAQSQRLDFEKVSSLTFHSPDLGRFPCLALAMEVAKAGGLAQTVLCSADEECVWAYLKRRIKFNDVARIITDVLSNLRNITRPTIKEILQADRWAREQVKSRI